MYKIKVNALYDFDVSKEVAQNLDAISTTPENFHILQDNESVNATVLDSNFNQKTYLVKVNNNTYNVVINDALDQQIQALGFQIGLSKQINELKAPMPGLILEINVKEGMAVKENEALLILEAMKMENVINAPRDGIIKSIKINTGDTVDKNTLLIEFES